MGWEDRVKEAAYTPPSGTRLVFIYEDVSRETDKKTTVFTFPDKRGAYVQDLGKGGSRYPMRFIFWGEDYDTAAQTFYEALSETGGGVLEHPVYGRKEVVPTGSIRQVDRLKTEANQAIIEVVFWESILDLTFPTAETDATDAANSAVENYTVIAPEFFWQNLDITKSGEKVSFVDKFRTGMNTARTTMQNVVGKTESVKRRFDAAYDAIVDNLNELVDTPRTLAQQTIAFIRLPIEAAGDIRDKVDAFGNLISSFTGTSFETSFDNQPNNAFTGAELFANSAQMALIESTIDSEFISKPQAILSAEYFLDKFVELSEWADESRDALNMIDTGETYQAVLNASSISAGRLVEISFSLLQEKIITLQAPTTFINLVAELYGELDDKYDFFITSNNLVGAELLEIPKGREIKYYE